jgi:hypothetical protein
MSWFVLLIVIWYNVWMCSLSNLLISTFQSLLDQRQFGVAKFGGVSHSSFLQLISAASQPQLEAVHQCSKSNLKLMYLIYVLVVVCFYLSFYVLQPLKAPCQDRLNDITKCLALQSPKFHRSTLKLKLSWVDTFYWQNFLIIILFGYIKVKQHCNNIKMYLNIYRIK